MSPAGARVATRPGVLARALRLPFLSVSAAAVALGWATARLGGAALDPATAAATLLGALLVHAGVNVLNDYYDHLNGVDAANDSALPPYTGGSRVIQEGLVPPRAMARLGTGLLGAGALAGLWLSAGTGPALLPLGALGLALGWAYSAPPAWLAARGLGEAAVAAGFGLLVPLGADFVQRGALSAVPLAAGLPYGLLVAALLFVNEIPDRPADAACGKRNWAVRLGPEHGPRGFFALLGASGAALGLAVAAGALPAPALGAGGALLPGLLAGLSLRRHRHHPARLGRAIRLSLAAALAYPLLLGAILYALPPTGAQELVRGMPSMA